MAYLNKGAAHITGEGELMSCGLSLHNPPVLRYVKVSRERRIRAQ